MTVSAISVRDIDACLPQTQCTKCGYPRCLAYASAIYAGEAAINQCPPGGQVTIDLLARLLGRKTLPLDPHHGVHESRKTARVLESQCIGCALCVPTCPVDAILGAAKQMHTVIDADCTGCELCVPVCPVDCIQLLPRKPAMSGTRWAEYQDVEIDRARRHNIRHVARQEPSKRAREASPQQRRRASIRADIVIAVNRVRARRARISSFKSG